MESGDDTALSGRPVHHSNRDEQLLLDAGVGDTSLNFKSSILQVLEGSRTAGLSNTICVSDPNGECQSLQSKLITELAELGDIARADLSLGMIQECVLLTYFDVRATQKVLTKMSGRAEAFPAVAHDCRIVRVNMSEFFAKVPLKVAAGGFEQFGEVAHMAKHGGDVLVEYFDMRAAQKLLKVAGNSAQPWMLLYKGNNGATSVRGTCGVNPLSSAGDNTSALTTPSPGLQQVTQEPRPKPQAELNAEPRAEKTASQGLTPLARAALAAEEGRFGGGEAPLPPSPGVGEEAGNGKDKRMLHQPVRRKVSTKEFSKYDIDPTNCCDDRRTTVMVRGLCGPSCRKDFLCFLERCGLSERYTFFYMPCKDHRNEFKGLAFVNLATPSDVHKLYVMVKGGFWGEFMTAPKATVPAVSYAHFQGHEELVKHFLFSAVLHEQDPDKRPIFRLDVLKAIREQQGNPAAEAPAAPPATPLDRAIPSLAEESEHPRKVGSGNNTDLQTALSQAAKEKKIAFILMRQTHEAHNANLQQQNLMRADLPAKVITSRGGKSCGALDGEDGTSSTEHLGSAWVGA